MPDKLQLLYDAIKKKNLIVFVGSGISQNLKNTNGEAMPTWGGLIEDVVQFASITTNLSEKSLAEKLTEIDKIDGNKKKDFKEKVLKAKYSIDPKNFESTEIKTLFDLIVKVSNGRIITTNYDDAFNVYDYLEAKKPIQRHALTIYKSAKDLSPLNELTALTNATNFVAKIHGSQDETAIVFPSDYVSLYQNNSTDNDANKNLKLFLDNAIQNFPILFLGFSMSDEEINRITTNITTRVKTDTKTYFVIGHDNFLSEKGNVNFISIESDKDGSKLTPIVEKLEKLWKEATKEEIQEKNTGYDDFKFLLNNTNFDKANFYDRAVKKITAKFDDWKNQSNFSETVDKVIDKIETFDITDSDKDALSNLQQALNNVSTLSEQVNRLKFLLFKLDVEQETKQTIAENLDDLKKASDKLLTLKKNIEQYESTIEKTKLKSLKDNYNKCIENRKKLFDKIFKFDKQENDKEEKLTDIISKITIDKLVTKYGLQILDDTETLGGVILRQNNELEAYATINKTAENRFYLIQNEAKEITSFVDLKYLKRSAQPENYSIEISKLVFSVNTHEQKVFPKNPKDLMLFFTNSSIKVNFEEYIGGTKTSIPAPFAFIDSYKRKSISYKSILAEIIKISTSLYSKKQLSELSGQYRPIKEIVESSDFSDMPDDYDSYPLHLSKISSISTYYHFLSRKSLSKLYEVNKEGGTVKDLRAFEKCMPFPETASIREVLKYFSEDKEDFVIIKTNGGIKMLHYQDIFSFIYKNL